MTAKLTLEEIHCRLLTRNNKYPTRPVYICPPDQEYLGNNKPLRFKCHNNHEWNGTVDRVIMAGRGCPICKKNKDGIQKRIPFKSLLEQFIKAHPHPYSYNESSYVNTHTPMIATCASHGDFKITPSLHKKGNQSCPQCKKQLRLDSFINKAKLIHDNFFSYNSHIQEDNKIVITCPTHGDFIQHYYTHLRGHGCPSCVNGKVSNKQIFWLNEVASEQNIFIEHAGNVGEHRITNSKFKADGFHKDTNTVYEFHGDAFHGNPQRYEPEHQCHPFNSLTSAELYSKTKEKEQHIIDCGYNLVIMWESEFDVLYPNFKNTTTIKNGSVLSYTNHAIPTELMSTLKISLVGDAFSGYKQKHDFKCEICGNIFKTTLTQRKQAFKKYNSVGCPNCNKNKSFAYNIHTQISTVIPNTIYRQGIIHLTPTTMLLPLELNTNTESVGGYRNRWTSLIQEYEKNNQQLIILFQDEWLNHQPLILSKLQHITHQSDIAAIHARNCTVKEITKKQKNEFLNKHHIQNTDNSQQRLGAFYDDNLIAVMTFANPRIALGGRQNSEYNTKELTRFATDINYRIPGIASKILKFYETNYEWDSIFSFADRRWSTGNMYYQLGFELERINKPDYFYVIDNKRKHRWNFRKDILKNTLPDYNPQLTEYQNMLCCGIDRVWDCGTLRFVKHRNK